MLPLTSAFVFPLDYGGTTCHGGEMMIENGRERERERERERQLGQILQWRRRRVWIGWGLFPLLSHKSAQTLGKRLRKGRKRREERE